MTVRITTLCENTSGAIGFTGEWGLSILVEAGGEKVLLDTGFAGAVVKNADLAAINLKTVDKIVISHGHVDHTGGLRPLLTRMGKRVNIYAHPDIWGKKYVQVTQPGGEKRYRYAGVPYCREDLEGMGAVFVYGKEPVWLNECIVTTGEVPMEVSFESVDDNMFLRTSEGFVPDPMLDDQALVVKSGKGLVVLLGCAHRGTINTIMQARRITGEDRVYAVMGGTHLLRAGEEQLGQTIAALREIGVEKLGVSHCTGLPAAVALAREFGENFFFNNAGSVVEF